MAKTSTNIWQNKDDEQWVKLSRENTAFIERLTGRADASLHIRPRTEDEKPPAAAWWMIDTATMEIDAGKTLDESMTKVEHIRMFNRQHQEDHPLLIASVLHESGHGRFTNHRPQDFDKLTHQEWDLITMLDEPRIEARMLAEFPQYRKYLKSMVFKLVAPQVLLDQNYATVMVNTLNLMILVGGRVISGALPDDDPAVVGAMDAMKNVLGDEKYRALYALVEECVEEANTPEELRSVAQRIMELMKDELADANQDALPQMSCGSQDQQDGEDGQGQPGQSGQGQQSSGSGSSGSGDDSDDDAQDGSGSGSGAGDDQDGDQGDSDGSGSGSGDQDASEDDKDADGAAGGAGDMTDEQKKRVKDFLDAFEKMNEQAEDFAAGGDYGKPRYAETAKTKEEVTAEQEKRDAEKYASQVFNKDVSSVPGVGAGAGKGIGSGGNSRYAPVIEKKVDAATRDYAKKIKRDIEKAQFRDIDRTKVRTSLPPGRLRVSEVMRLQRQMNQNQELTATPWSQTRRRETDNPPINLAVMPDFSGSLANYQEEISQFAWAFSTAVRNLRGKSTVVAWDSRPVVTMEPNITYENLRVPNQGGSSSGLPEALLVADKVANLSADEGVKFAVIITDDELPNMATVMHRLKQMTKRGVKVLWITILEPSYWGPSEPYDLDLPAGATRMVYRKGESFAQMIGKPLIDALSDA